MQALLFLSASLLFLTACSSTPPEPEASALEADKKSISETDRCLDNPELAREWGDCNVKHTLFLESNALAKCRRVAPGAKGTVDFELQVRHDGKVKKAKARKSGANPKLVACLTGVMKKLRFAEPPKGKEPVITVPYQLTP